MQTQAATGQRASAATEVPMELLERYSAELSSSITGLGMWMRDRFDQAKRARVRTEDEWLRDFRQYKGLYEPDEWRKLTEQKYRSRLFMKITRKKVRAYDSRMMDMLFPAGKDKNWSIRSTPEPDMVMNPVAQAMIQQAQQQLAQAEVQQVVQQTGEAPEVVARRLQAGGYQPEIPREQMQQIQLSVSKAAATRMEQTIADQMSEIDYKPICKRALHSGHKYGVGIIKGPLVNKVERPSWSRDPNTGQWSSSMQEQLKPYVEFVPVWAFYPDPAAKRPEEMEFCFQRHLMTKGQVQELGNMPGFAVELIEQYLADYPDGDTSPLSWETMMDSQDDRNNDTAARTDRRYEVVEFWGALNDAQLRDLGLEDQSWVNIWQIGHFPIKSGPSPIEGLNHLYHFYFFEEDESSFWRTGVPGIIRDDQYALNSTIRAMMDNMASTVGPQWELNTDYLPPNEKSREIYPNRIWYRRGDGRYPALRAVEVSSRMNEFLSIKGTFETQIHETTLPAYMQGGQAGGAGRTASGLSMMMGSANLDVKDQITNFDLGVTRTLIRALYHWNMQFNEDEMVKGDYEVVARGASSLVAKEIRTQQLDQLLPLLTNPMYASYVDQRELLNEIFKARDLLDTEILLSPQEYDERKQMQQQIEQLQGQVQEGMQLISQLWKSAPTLVRQAMDKIPPQQIAQANASKQQ